MNAIKKHREYDQVSITVNWNSQTSIEEAEKTKFNLECKGYTLVSDCGGINQSAMIYRKYK
jgi:hypothetical protein